MSAAKKKSLDYNALIKKLRAGGSCGLYLLYGEEDYLRCQFEAELRTLCLPDGGNEFCHKRLSYPEADLAELREAVLTLPFLSERSLVEYRGFAINACKGADAECFGEIVSNIPSYCCLVITLPLGYEPDGRLSAFKAVKKYGEVIEFTVQSQAQILNWVSRRFKASGVDADDGALEQLIFMTGGLMGRLLPEIEKLADYSKDGRLTAEDVKTAAIRFPEASVFELTELLAERNFKKAAAALSELLYLRTEPIMILAMLGKTLRQMYMARLVLDKGGGVAELMNELDIKYEFIARRIVSGARGFDASELRLLLRHTADCDFAMKGARSSEGAAILTELMLHMAASKHGPAAVSKTGRSR